MEKLDIVVVGAGVIGLAIGRAFAARGREVVLIEAADTFGTGISSRSSEVIHAGIYYQPGSIKARTCVLGRDLLYQYCSERNIGHQQIGKLIVATNQEDLGRISKYRDRALENGVRDLDLLDAVALRSMEPSVAGLAALFSPSTGIVNSHQLMMALLSDIVDGGGHVIFNTRMLCGETSDSGVRFEFDDGRVSSAGCRLLVNAAGLDSQEVAASFGTPSCLIPPRYCAKGSYYALAGKSPFRHLIYPMADSASLGIHATLDLAGNCRFGPDLEWITDADLSFPEGREKRFIQSIARYYPEIIERTLVEAYSGIRPKIVGPGAAAADFVMQTESVHGQKGLVNLFGIESPGLTASLALAEQVVKSVDGE